MMDLTIDWVRPDAWIGDQHARAMAIPVVRLAEVETLIGYGVRVAESFQSMMLAWGKWDEGCFYYNGTSAGELATVLNDVEAFLASVAAWRTGQEGNMGQTTQRKDNAMIITEEMVERFLTWPLPESVCADLCATKQGAPHRTGTNLLSFTEAKQMLEHVLASTSSFSKALLKQAQEQRP